MNNPDYTAKQYKEERQAWHDRNIPGDAGLDLFDFPFDIKNPPKVGDGRASDDE